MTSLDDIARCAAEWWADRLMVAEKREPFRRALIDVIRARLPTRRLAIRVDYDPDDLLLQALDSVGIECRGTMNSARGIFPRKTTMIIRGEDIEAKQGYGVAFGGIHIRTPE